MGLVCGALLFADVYLVYIFHQVRPVPRHPSCSYLQCYIPSLTRVGVLEGDEGKMPSHYRVR